MAAWGECVRTGGVWYREHRFRGADGQYHAVLAKGVPIHDDNGSISGWAGINLDISRLKHKGKPTGARMSSSPRWRTNCATRWRRSATPRSCWRRRGPTNDSGNGVVT